MPEISAPPTPWLVEYEIAGLGEHRIRFCEMSINELQGAGVNGTVMDAARNQYHGLLLSAVDSRVEQAVTTAPRPLQAEVASHEAATILTNEAAFRMRNYRRYLTLFAQEDTKHWEEIDRLDTTIAQKPWHDVLHAKQHFLMQLYFGQTAALDEERIIQSVCHESGWILQRQEFSEAQLLFSAVSSDWVLEARRRKRYPRLAQLLDSLKP